jgi:hypothetical protein
LGLVTIDRYPEFIPPRLEKHFLEKFFKWGDAESTFLPAHKKVDAFRVSYCSNKMKTRIDVHFPLFGPTVKSIFYFITLLSLVISYI